jgi:hypothetical protein
MFNSNQAFLLMQKLEINPKGFTLGVKAAIEKNFFSICPKLLINAEKNLWLSIGPKAEKNKQYHQIWEANLQPLEANV